MKKLIAILVLLTLSIGVLTACSTDPGLKEAGEYLFSLYKDDSEVTASDYDVVGRVMIGDVVYTVDWTVDNTDNVTIKESSKEGFFTVDLNETTKTEVSYVLTATIKNESGKSIKKTFSRKIPPYKVFSYEELAKAKDDAPVVVEGIVTGIVTKSEGWSANSLYLQDLKGEGGYYVYNIGEDPVNDLGIKIGMTVSVTGVKDTYNGLYEVVNPTVKIIDATEKPVEPIDYTEIYKNASALTDESLVSKQSILVTLKGVEITTQSASDGYYKFKLGDKETYIRISSSNNCITKAETETLIKGHTDHAVWTANVTGIVQLYNGAFYLIPASVDAFEYLGEIQKTDAEKLQIEKDAISIIGNVTEDTKIILPANGEKYDEVKFVWSMTSSSAAVYNAEDNSITITLPDVAEKITLTVTITCGEATETVNYDIEIDAKTTDYYVPEKITELKVDTAFKLSLYQANLGKYLYFAGSTASKDWYLATTDKGDKATDVYLEAVEGVEGAYRMYFYAGEVKTYIEVYERSAGSGSLQLVTETPENYYTYNADLGLLVVVAGENSYYLGTYSNFDTFSASNTSYITGENASKVGVSQFPAVLSTLAPALPTPEKVETLVVDKAFKLSLYQANLGKFLYFAGSTASKDWYLATTDKAEKATDVYLEAVEGVEGAYRMYFYAGEVKTYIEVYERSAGSGSLQLVTETPENYYTYNADLGLLVVVAGENSYYLGTYSNFDTFSASNTSYITGDNASKVGVSQFPAVLSTVVLKKVENVKIEEPVVDKALKLHLNQANLGKDLYFAGSTANKDWYLAATDKLSKATDVYLEAVEGVEGGYRMYFYAGADKTKTYIEVYERSAGSGSLQLVTETPENYYTYNADLGLLVVVAGENSYYLGTYSTYDTFSASNTSYITGDNASKVGVSQFPAYLVNVK